MLLFPQIKKLLLVRRSSTVFFAVFFFLSTFCDVWALNVALLPEPGRLFSLSLEDDPIVLKGLRFDPEHPLDLEFIVDANGQAIDQAQVFRLIAYFFAGLTMPKGELWVNLAPDERDRVIPDALAKTDLGEEMLKQDYLLKQLAASLTCPETEAGKRYWGEVNGQDTSTRPSFTKVWIKPGKAAVYENNNTAIVTQATLKVQIGNGSRSHFRTETPEMGPGPISAFTAHILPLIEKEVNSGEHFAQLRQIYQSFLLAAWFKNKVKESVYKHYIDTQKVSGIDLKDKNAKEKIFDLYVQAFEKGAYNYTKSERIQNKITKRAYFSGGVQVNNSGTVTEPADAQKVAGAIDVGSDVTVEGNAQKLGISRAAKMSFSEMLFDDVSEAIENGDEAALSGLFAEMDDEEARDYLAQLVSDSPENKKAIAAVRRELSRRRGEDRISRAAKLPAAKAQYDTVESLVGPIRDILFSGTQNPAYIIKEFRGNPRVWGNAYGYTSLFAPRREDNKERLALLSGMFDRCSLKDMIEAMNTYNNSVNSLYILKEIFNFCTKFIG